MYIFLKLKLFRSETCRSFCSSIRQAVDISFVNPCISLQQYVEVPLFKKHEISFNPTIEDMQEARELFVPKIGHEINFLPPAYFYSQAPEHDLPEVTFLGRSNAGKSSILKAILNYVPYLNVRTSKKAGHTKLLNFFKIGTKLCLVDLPGYGYRQPKCFDITVESYLKNRKNLLKTFMLIDAEIGFESIDEIALDMLEEFRIPYAIILTKIDKVNDATRLRHLLHLQNIRDKHTSVSCFPQPFMTSSKTLEGLGYLQAYIAHITGNLNVIS